MPSGNAGNVAFSGGSALKPPPGIDLLSRGRSAPVGSFNPSAAMQDRQQFDNSVNPPGNSFPVSAPQGNVASTMYNQPSVQPMGQSYDSVGGDVRSQGNGLGLRNYSDPNPQTFGLAENGSMAQGKTLSWNARQELTSGNVATPSWDNQVPKSSSLGPSWSSASSFNAGGRVIDTPSDGSSFGSGIFSMSSNVPSSGWDQKQRPQNQPEQGGGRDKGSFQSGGTGANWQLGGGIAPGNSTW